MDDFKKVAVGLYELVLEEHAILALGALTSFKGMIKCSADAILKVNKFLNEHDGDFKKALLEVKANEMLNQEV
ncbi:MAG: hypothetical protein UF085_04870 [Collinsella sp.]|nr:hypothetical protein [Collinsella sp.]